MPIMSGVEATAALIDEAGYLGPIIGITGEDAQRVDHWRADVHFTKGMKAELDVFVRAICAPGGGGATAE